MGAVHGAGLSLHPTVQMLTLRTVGTIGNKSQANKRISLDIPIKHVKELLKSFKVFTSSGCENCCNLKYCKANIHRLKEIEIKFEDSHVTVPCQQMSFHTVVKRLGFFHPVLHHFTNSFNL